MAQSVNLGETPKDNDIRDALHIAVISGLAGEKLKAGQNIKLQDGVWISCNVSVSTAVVDPYIKKPLIRGDLFWACLLPNTVTDVRHVWTHPDFPVKVEIQIDGREYTPEQSQEWLEDFCDRTYGIDYDTIISAVTQDRSYDHNTGCGWSVGGEYFTIYGSDAGGEIPRELWDHVKNVTGKDPIYRPTRFTCSC